MFQDNVPFEDVQPCPEYFAGRGDPFNNQVLRDLRENGADSSEQHPVILIIGHHLPPPELISLFCHHHAQRLS
jgi:hypothetical protein